MWRVVVSAALFLALFGATAAAEDVVRFDFETGDLQGWQVVEGNFSKLLGDREFEFHSNTAKYTNDGAHYLTTLEQADSDRPNDKPTGVVESPVFVLAGPTASMLVGGGSHLTTYIALCTEDGEEVLHARGRNSQTMHRVEWDVKPWIGRRVFLRLVDRNTGGWGHVTFDDFRAEGRIDPEATRERNVGRARAEVAAVQSPLRRAIEHHTATFGERYPKGSEYLARFERLEDALAKAEGDDAARMEEEFDALRREALVANPLVSGQPLLYVVRHQYRSDHHNTATMFQTGEINTGSFQ
ncbi:MAG: hypothetical protein ACOCWL_03870, partial [Thermoguttaceae bacterium]